jgi:hypothetical protein
MDMNIHRDMNFLLEFSAGVLIAPAVPAKLASNTGLRNVRFPDVACNAALL